MKLLITKKIKWLSRPLAVCLVPQAVIRRQTCYKASEYSMRPMTDDLLVLISFPGAHIMHQGNLSRLGFTVAKVMYQQIKGW